MTASNARPADVAPSPRHRRHVAPHRPPPSDRPCPRACRRGRREPDDGLGTPRLGDRLGAHRPPLDPVHGPAAALGARARRHPRRDRDRAHRDRPRRHRDGPASRGSGRLRSCCSRPGLPSASGAMSVAGRGGSSIRSSACSPCSPSAVPSRRSSRRPTAAEPRTAASSSMSAGTGCSSRAAARGARPSSSRAASARARPTSRGSPPRSPRRRGCAPTTAPAAAGASPRPGPRTARRSPATSTRSSRRRATRVRTSSPATPSGGVYVRFFAAAYPDEVAGVVLLDAQTPARGARPRGSVLREPDQHPHGDPARASPESASPDRSSRAPRATCRPTSRPAGTPTR